MFCQYKNGFFKKTNINPERAYIPCQNRNYEYIISKIHKVMSQYSDLIENHQGDFIMAQTLDHKKRVQMLKKISISIKAGTQPNGNNLIANSTTFDMIFGIGVEGLTPFEYLLSEKVEGDSFSLELHPDEVCRTFQHITLPHFVTPESSEPIFFNFQVIKVDEAHQREVIKAMAELSSCSGGSCECCGH